MAITKNSQIDLNGNEMILDADGDTTITADTDDQIDFKTAGTDRVAIGASGNLFVGSSTSNGISGGTAGLQVTGAGFNGAISASRHDNNQYGSSIMLGKSRNTTVGSNTIIHNNDGIGAITFFADDGTNLDSRVANISALVDGTPGENDTPGRLVFETTADGSAAPSERMRIDSSGKVGIGCTPHFTFDVQLNSSRRIGFNYSDSQNAILSHDGSGNIETLALRGNTLLFYSDYDASNPDGVERMRVDESGRLLIGLTATQNYESASGRPNDVLQVKGAEGINAKATTNGGGCFVALGDSGNTAGSHFIAVDSSGNIDFRVYNSNGNVVNTNGVYSTVSSDRRTKENITDATGKLEDLCRLNVKNFTYKDYPNNGKQIGFMADEMESVFPNLVTQEDTRVYDDDGNLVKGYEDQKSVKVGGPVFAILTKAIQEQQTIIEDLKDRITTLEAAE